MTFADTQFPRPRGRAPAGKQWDLKVGEWVVEATAVPDSNGSGKTLAPAASAAGAGSSADATTSLDDMYEMARQQLKRLEASQKFQKRRDALFFSHSSGFSPTALEVLETVSADLEREFPHISMLKAQMSQYAGEHSYTRLRLFRPIVFSVCAQTAKSQNQH